VTARTLVPKNDLAHASYPRGRQCPTAVHSTVQVPPNDGKERTAWLSFLPRQGLNAWLVAAILACIGSSTAQGEDRSSWVVPSFPGVPTASEQTTRSQVTNTNGQTPFAKGNTSRLPSYENSHLPMTTETPPSPFGDTSRHAASESQSLNQSGPFPPAVRNTDSAPAPQPVGRPQSPTGAIPLRHAGETNPRGVSPTESAPSFGSRTAPWMTTLSALAIALGTLFLFYWGVKRLGPRTDRIVPNEVVEMLGYTPLSGRQRLCLIRVGRKLVLVAASSDAVEPLTEIDDPVEVDRLVGLCASQRNGSVTQAFQQVFSQYVNASNTNG